jgi:hypothetical protein
MQHCKLIHGIRLEDASGWLMGGCRGQTHSSGSVDALCCHRQKALKNRARSGRRCALPAHGGFELTIEKAVVNRESRIVDLSPRKVEGRSGGNASFANPCQ